MPDQRFYNARLQAGFADGQVVGNRAQRQGGFTTLRAKKDARMDRRLGVGGAASTDSAVNVVTNGSTTGVAQYGVRMRSTASNAATTEFNQFSAEGGTQAAVFTCATVRGYRARNVTKGAGSTVTLQVGVDVDDLTSGTTNYGYRGQVLAGLNKFNLYIDGTAINYLGANLLIGTTADGMTAGGSLAVAQDFAHRGAKAGFYNTAPIAKPTVSGNQSSTNAVQNIATALASLGLITNVTTFAPASVGGAATDLATAITLVNAMRSALITQGYVAP